MSPPPWESTRRPFACPHKAMLKLRAHFKAKSNEEQVLLGCLRCCSRKDGRKAAMMRTDEDEKKGLTRYPERAVCGNDAS